MSSKGLVALSLMAAALVGAAPASALSVSSDTGDVRLAHPGIRVVQHLSFNERTGKVSYSGKAWFPEMASGYCAARPLITREVHGHPVALNVTPVKFCAQGMYAPGTAWAFHVTYTLSGADLAYVRALSKREVLTFSASTTFASIETELQPN